MPHSFFVETRRLEESREGQADYKLKLLKNPPAMKETLVRFLGWEDPLEKGTATHYSILA